MIEAQPIGWWNTGFPLVLLGTLAVVLPRVFVGETRSQRVVMLGGLTSVVVLLVVGAVVFMGLYGWRGVDVWAALTAAPVATAGFFLRLSGLAGLVWGPVLALVWLGLAQGVEKRKGEDVVRGEGI